MPNLVRRQCRLFALYRMVLSVRKRIQWGIGLFCFNLTANVRLVRKVFCDGCERKRKKRKDGLGKKRVKVVKIGEIVATGPLGWFGKKEVRNGNWLNPTGQRFPSTDSIANFIDIQSTTMPMEFSFDTNKRVVSSHGPLIMNTGPFSLILFVFISVPHFLQSITFPQYENRTNSPW